MEKLNEGHFFYGPSQGNIYTLTEMKLVNGSTKLLMASLKREVLCLEYQESSKGSLVPTTRDISFTYIPNGAEIISLDAFNKSLSKNEFVIGITIIKNSNDAESRLETYLNIYSEWEETEEFDIENIAQSCLNVELNYIPYKLLHTDLVTWKNNLIESKEQVFVLSGSDNQVHIYREHANEHVYKEIEKENFFPEFTKMPSPVIWIDIYYTEDFTERVTSLACECGYIKLIKIDVRENKVLHNFSTRFGNYVPQVRIYPQYELEAKFEFLKNNKFEIFKDKKKLKTNDDRNLNLVVVNSILPPVIFHNVLKYGLSNYSMLPRLDSTSILTCCEVADINFDGEKEILVGTSSEEIMLFKKNKEKGWCLEEVKNIVAPILGLKYVDMSGDGIKELVVLSMKGVHVLQHNLTEVQKLLETKIRNVLCE